MITLDKDITLRCRLVSNVELDLSSSKRFLMLPHMPGHENPFSITTISSQPRTQIQP